MTSQKNFKNFENKYYTHDSIDSLSSFVGNKDGYLCEVEVRKRALHTKKKCEENEKKKKEEEVEREKCMRNVFSQ